MFIGLSFALLTTGGSCGTGQVTIFHAALLLSNSLFDCMKIFLFYFKSFVYEVFCASFCSLDRRSVIKILCAVFQPFSDRCGFQNSISHIAEMFEQRIERFLN